MYIRNFLLLLLFLFPLHLAANTSEISLQSSYLYPSIEGIHRIRIQGELGGDATIVLDSNVCGLNQFGDITICTQMYFEPTAIRMKQLRIADPKGMGRFIYQLEGVIDPDYEYYLVTPPKKGGGFRLIVVDQYEETKRVIPLEMTEG
ncbi:MAG: hypothetical protein WAM28_03970 [Chlamydiales bacterium]